MNIADIATAQPILTAGHSKKTKGVWGIHTRTYINRYGWHRSSIAVVGFDTATPERRADLSLLGEAWGRNARH